jgi:hypothetical protein
LFSIAPALLNGAICISFFDMLLLKDRTVEGAGGVGKYTAMATLLEVSEPQCQLCVVDPVCAHRKELFQPVIRTIFN